MMADALALWEKPEVEEIYLVAGWRQWADGGSISSGLPHYLIQKTGARQIGEIRPDGFYLFQIPGTHDLVRPVVRFEEGYPESLKIRQNELHFARLGDKGLVIFLGDEPHMDVERYVDALLSAARQLNVRRIISFGGVYGELPYDKERMVSAIFSLPEMKAGLEPLALNFSNYQGGASIGSYVCRRAGELGIEMVGLYAFVPTYDFSSLGKVENSIRIENDFMAWLNVMRRVEHMLNLGFDLSDLEARSQRLIEVIEAKIDEIDEASPQLGLREYMQRLSDEFVENPFNPLDEIWEEELKRLFGKMDDEQP
jgi:proteasome assembly chaperone (PAC2) family protein